MTQKKLIVIAGPTAVGKTAMAIRIARQFNTEIVSADSRQCFRELNIGVAKPSPEELSEVKHHFIDSHSIHQEVNAAVFETFALQTLNSIYSRNEIAVLVGGTGLYINALLNGFDEIPEVVSSVRNNIISEYQRSGLQWLQASVSAEDPLYFESGEILNPQRLMRALEVKRSTGKSIREFQQKKQVSRPFEATGFCLHVPKEELNASINMRVERMMRAGLEQEVRSLLPLRHLNALNTVGYKELFRFFDGEVSLPTAVEEIKKNTRHYAKRQLTWFRKQNFTWISPIDDDKVIDFFHH